jgi:parallel beta-helix repeat protein
MHRKSCLGVAAAVVALAAPSAAQAVEFRVDDDRAQCPTAEFTSINQAILAAAPGDTIRVCPGTYPEYVLVTKPIELRGAKSGNAAAPSRSEDEVPDPTKESVVVNGGQGGFDVIASGVVIDGFTIQGNPGAASYPNAGIYLRTGSDREILDNVIRDNGLGTYAEGAQSNLTIQRNAYLDNRREPNPSFIPAGGIFAAGGQLNETEIQDNLFSGNAQFAINIGDGSAGGLEITHNEAEDESTFLVIGRTTNTLVAYNRVEDLRASGILAFGSTVGMRVEHNDFRAGETNSNGSAIRFTSSFGAGANDAPIIEHNKAFGFSLDGVSLNRTTGATVRHNQLDLNRHGVRLQDADGSTITNNDARRNRGDGLRAEQQSTGNTLRHNIVLDNLEHDCHDDTVGPGTAGTANFWIDNKGRTENRPGLCIRP